MSVGTASVSGLASQAGGRVSARARVLREGRDFEVVLRSGCRIASRNFVLRAFPNGVSHARLGIIAARKVAARAVDRNRGKRLIREAFRAVAAGIGTYDVTLQLRNNLRDELNSALRVELDGLLGKFLSRCGAPDPQSSR